MSLLLLLLLSGRPVIELDDLVVEGDIRRPRILQFEASQLPEKLENAAIYNLMELEKRLLSPLRPEAFQEMKKSAK